MQGRIALPTFVRVHGSSHFGDHRGLKVSMNTAYLGPQVYVNFDARGGKRLSDHDGTRFIIHEMQKYPGNIFIVFLGDNDLRAEIRAHGTKATGDPTFNEYKKLMIAAKTHLYASNNNNGGMLVLCTLLPNFSNPEYEKLAKEVDRRVLSMYPGMTVKVVNLRTIMDMGGRRLCEWLYQRDGVHLSSAGNDRLGGALARAMRAAVAVRSGELRASDISLFEKWLPTELMLQQRQEGSGKPGEKFGDLESAQYRPLIGSDDVYRPRFGSKPEIISKNKGILGNFPEEENKKEIELEKLEKEIIEIRERRSLDKEFNKNSETDGSDSGNERDLEKVEIEKVEIEKVEVNKIENEKVEIDKVELDKVEEKELQTRVIIDPSGVKRKMKKLAPKVEKVIPPRIKLLPARKDCDGEYVRSWDGVWVHSKMDCGHRPQPIDAFAYSNTKPVDPNYIQLSNKVMFDLGDFKKNGCF